MVTVKIIIFCPQSPLGPLTRIQGNLFPVKNFYRSRLPDMDFEEGGMSFENWRRNRGSGNEAQNVLPDEEREKLREDLKMKFEQLLKEYQMLTHKRHLVYSQVRRQLELEDRLKFLECS
jgi:hypothetical protein